MTECIQPVLIHGIYYNPDFRTEEMVPLSVYKGDDGRYYLTGGNVPVLKAKTIYPTLSGNTDIVPASVGVRHVIVSSLVFGKWTNGANDSDSVAVMMTVNGEAVVHNYRADSPDTDYILDPQPMTAPVLTGDANTSIYVYADKTTGIPAGSIGITVAYYDQIR